MPVAPSFYSLDQPVTAKQLNTDLYTYTPGNNHTPNGILFHSNRPLYLAGLFTPSFSSTFFLTGGAEFQLTVSQGYTWQTFFDNSALFGPGGDNPELSSTGQFRANVPGSSGYPDVAGGIYLAWFFPVITSISANGAFGAGLFINCPNASEFPAAGTVLFGGQQAVNTAQDGCAYVLDAYNAYNNVPNITTSTFMSGFGGGTAIAQANAIDYSGETTRFSAMWVSNNTNGSTVSTLPVPLASYGTGTTVSSAFLNSGSGIAGPLAFLNYPPVLRVCYTGGATIPATTVTAIPFASGTANGQQIDTYSGFSGTHYTVPVSGVYLCHGAIVWPGFASPAAQMASGIRVGTVNMWGPPYQQASGGITSNVTWLADLQAGDTVSLVGYTTAGTTLPASQFNANRLVLSWMGGLGSPSTFWTPPDTGFRWSAGAGSLPALFNTHLANDLSFLMQRPYLLTSQSVAGSQTGFHAGSFNTIHMDTVAGPVHGTVGDNYGGWNGTSYVAQIPGWYLATCGYTVVGATSTCFPIAGFLQSPTSLLATVPQAITQEPQDWYQHMYSTSTTLHPGAEGIGLYYLRAGDTLTPQANLQSGGTWGTSFNIGTAVGNHFGLIWVSE